MLDSGTHSWEKGTHLPVFIIKPRMPVITAMVSHEKTLRKTPVPMCSRFFVPLQDFHVR